MSTGSVAVVDSWSILAFLRAEEPGAAAMRRYLRRARTGNLRLLLNVVNLGEVFYRLIQLTGVTRAEERLAEIKALPIEIVPAREGMVLEAARIKAAHRLAYADAFAVATGRAESAPIITGDPEILALPAAVIRVRKLERNA
jgi:uncharacterized protein